MAGDLRGQARYEKGVVVGKGTYGIVSKAKDRITGEIVAIKRIRLGNTTDGVSFTALREIKLLKELHHENILKDVFSTSSGINLVLDFMQHDLDQVIRETSIALMPGDIKAFMQMALRGVAACHDRWILHRDLKPDNLLIGADGVLKLGDFGFARMHGSPSRRYTHQVCTRFYRAPELLFGARTYSGAIDMWAMGCIFAELHLRTPYLPGQTDLEQLSLIFAALGTPTEEVWPGVSTLPDYIEYEEREAPPLQCELFTAADANAIDLLSGMLRFDPNTRLTAHEALDHPYFSSGVPATPPESLPKPTVKSPPRYYDSDTDDEDMGDGGFDSGGGGGGGSSRKRTSPGREPSEESPAKRARREEKMSGVAKKLF